tara:strand:- start:559 stop:1062 length:504 start_codon:yes stop_codon:yes gene_type:complete
LNLNNKILIAKIQAHQGLNGWLKVYSYSETKQKFSEYKYFFIQKDNNTIRLDIEDISIGKSIKVKFKNFNCREDSQDYIGEEIFINEDQLDVLEANQFYWNELIGLTAYLNNGKKIGIVSDIIETGSNDVLVIKGEEEILVPYVFGESVMEVVVEEKKIIINEAYCE